MIEAEMRLYNENNWQSVQMDETDDPNGHDLDDFIVSDDNNVRRIYEKEGFDMVKFFGPKA
jgi:hypothetical protein